MLFVRNGVCNYTCHIFIIMHSVTLFFVMLIIVMFSVAIMSVIMLGVISYCYAESHIV